ncbi:BlaI/MecI/CopY family transcriptional regulator [Peristeroidobacter agariperforans]|uniref:BlaI/MecI/CopY family transcriptional regulator n=1 Tax=Peristeroidobacter agariperforans TaxID=268404 RepID=UPI00101B8810|nr:BlaI/MecI/CopY family transcriptional regulator [Peristeroidobacter agariperforans]
MVRKSRVARIAQPIEKPLTATELEMMNVIWRIGPCSVLQVVEQLRPERELAYTSVSTIVRILEQKGYVISSKEGRGHLYDAAVSKEDYQRSTLKRMVTSVFDDTPALLVRRLLDTESLSSDDLAEIRALLRKKGK